MFMLLTHQSSLCARPLVCDWIQCAYCLTSKLVAAGIAGWTEDRGGPEFGAPHV